MARAWFVEETQDWGGDEGPALLIHDGGDSIAIPVTELELFLVALGETLSKMGYFDGSDLLKFLIKQVIKDSRPSAS